MQTFCFYHSICSLCFLCLILTFYHLLLFEFRFFVGWFYVLFFHNWLLILRFTFAIAIHTFFSLISNALSALLCFGIACYSLLLYKNIYVFFAVCHCCQVFLFVHCKQFIWCLTHWRCNIIWRSMCIKCVIAMGFYVFSYLTILKLWNCYTTLQSVILVSGTPQFVIKSVSKNIWTSKVSKLNWNWNCTFIIIDRKQDRKSHPKRCLWSVDRTTQDEHQYQHQPTTPPPMTAPNCPRRPIASTPNPTPEPQPPEPIAILCILIILEKGFVFNFEGFDILFDINNDLLNE